MVTRKDINVQIGKRLQEVREYGGYSQDEFAEAINTGVEHYRKLENGMYGIQAEKFLVLYGKYGIDPTYLITGKIGGSCDIIQILNNCSKEERTELLRRIMEYALKLPEETKSD